MTHSAAIIMRKKRRRRRRRAMRRMICMAGLMVLIVGAIRTASDYLLPGSRSGKEENYVKPVSTTDVSKPAQRHSSKIYADLQKLAQTDRKALEIYENRSRYPQTLLAAYLNNTEMEDFVAGYQNIAASASGGLSAEETRQSYPLLLQWDKRWGYVSYGGSMIGLSGCGPTCLSMVLVTLTQNAGQTPDAVAQFSEANGYYVEGSGTSWSLMTDGASQLGLYAQELSLDESVMKSALDAGKPIICSMGAGDFTTQGHFILIRGYDEQGFVVNDPNCISRSGRRWTFDQLQGQIKNMWAYSSAL